MILIIDSGE